MEDRVNAGLRGQFDFVSNFIDLAHYLEGTDVAGAHLAQSQGKFEIASEVEYLWVLALKEECGVLADS